MADPLPHPTRPKRLPGAPGPVHYFLACLSFIPFLGLPLAVGSIIFGSLKMDRGGGRLLAMGVGGILATALTVYFGASIGIKKFLESDVIRAGLVEASQDNLDTLALAIENFKTEVGSYPDSLADLDDSTVATVDPLHVLMHSGDEGYISYGYEKLGDEEYTVYSVGVDKLAGTKDDIYPSDSVTVLCEGFRKPKAEGIKDSTSSESRPD